MEPGWNGKGKAEVLGGAWTGRGTERTGRGAAQDGAQERGGAGLWDWGHWDQMGQGSVHWGGTGGGTRKGQGETSQAGGCTEKGDRLGVSWAGERPHREGEVSQAGAHRGASSRCWLGAEGSGVFAQTSCFPPWGLSLQAGLGHTHQKPQKQSRCACLPDASSCFLPAQASHAGTS
ncbi:hypothetical protein KIL84_013762 [Mauremys mutica]|uniref:Uncharacterized protein n=1 Tax=Mauremys mutica TaxID=74926 RepID=A0A9D3WY10_9SAUR|nr:hypothetical protein KIL84_013762 [Mauremys mutica]